MTSAWVYTVRKFSAVVNRPASRRVLDRSPKTMVNLFSVQLQVQANQKDGSLVSDHSMSPSLSGQVVDESIIC